MVVWRGYRHDESSHTRACCLRRRVSAVTVGGEQEPIAAFALHVAHRLEPVDQQRVGLARNVAKTVLKAPNEVITGWQ
jgi:hypothetical protein